MEQSRCTEYVTAAAVKTKRGGTPPVHIVVSQNASSAWSECGQLIDSRRHKLVTEVPWVEVTCRSCREGFLRAKQGRKAGWWGR